ncbi:unnamed protein product, partial [Hapterophycus canaliculatus]
MSLSPSFLGVLYPHAGCRVDSAVTLLCYVKTIPEAVFCLNMFSHALQAASSAGCNYTGEGCGETRLPGLSDSLSTAVGDVLARFPVGELALSSIPLSAAALSFALLAGCDGFVADWLVAAPLAGIKRALREFGAFGGRPQQYVTGDTADTASSSKRRGEQQQHYAPISAECIDREALVGVTGAALSRWGAEVERGVQQHSQSDAVAHRLTCVLLMAPDTLLPLAFDFDSRRHEPPDRERKEQRDLAYALGDIISDALAGLSAEFSAMIVSRQRGTAGDNHRNSSKLACVSQVSQLAAAFLHARCTQGCYSSASGDASPDAAATFSSTRELPEISLARACGGLLQWMLDPRRGRSSNTAFGGGNGEDGAHRALLSVLNLLCMLLVLERSRRGLAAALEESREALSEVLSPSARAVERLLDWSGVAPDILAAFLQACALWNATEPASSGSDDEPDFRRLDIPFQVLSEVLSSADRGPYLMAGGGSASTNGAGRSKRKASSLTVRRAVRAPLLRVLAMRSVETSARARSF